MSQITWWLEMDKVGVMIMSLEVVSLSGSYSFSSIVSEFRRWMAKMCWGWELPTLLALWSRNLTMWAYCSGTRTWTRHVNRTCAVDRCRWITKSLRQLCKRFWLPLSARCASIPFRRRSRNARMVICCAWNAERDRTNVQYVGTDIASCGVY